MRYPVLAGFVAVCTLAAPSNSGGGSIEGHVLNSLTSAPIRKAMVILTSPKIRLNAGTDAEGKFQFTALPPATYRLSASRSGFLDHPARRPIQLGPDAEVTGTEIRLPPAGVIAGHVLDEDGEPVDRARVSMFKQSYRDGSGLWDWCGAPGMNPEKNDSGEFRFPNLAPGRYLVQAQDQRPAINSQYGVSPNAVYVSAYYPSAPSEKQAVPVEVGIGAEVHGIDIQLFKVARVPSVHVRGKVTGVPPDSQMLVSVGLYPVDGGGGGNTVAEPPDYAFDLSVPPGQYTLRGNMNSGGPGAYGADTVSVTGDVAGVVLSLSPAAEIAGRVRLSGSGAKANLEGVKVVLISPGRARFASQAFELRSDAAGKLVCSNSFRPGHYVVRVHHIPDGYFVQELKFGGEEIFPDDFEIVTSGQLEIVLSNTAGKIAGSVSDADGKPFPISSVTLIPPDRRSWPARQSSDDAGKFQFTGLRPGKYKLFAWEEVDDDLWQDPEFRKKYESLASEITVGPGETQNVQLRVIAAEEMK